MRPPGWLSLVVAVCAVAATLLAVNRLRYQYVEFSGRPAIVDRWKKEICIANWEKAMCMPLSMSGKP